MTHHELRTAIEKILKEGNKLPYYDLDLKKDVDATTPVDRLVTLFTSHTSDLQQKIEGMKIECEGDSCECETGYDEAETYVCEHCDDKMKERNKTIDDVLALITERKQ